jgi:hypothetical protein
MPNVKIALTKMRCISETNEYSDSDEPYVLVFAAQIRNIGGLVNIPAAVTVMYGPWEDVDNGDLISTSVSIPGPIGKILNHPSENFWGLDGKPHELNNLDDVIFLTALMENDDAQAGGIRAGLHAQLFASISSYANAGMSRSSMVSHLIKDMRDILKGITVTGIPSSDDLLGVSEVRFDNDALQKVTKQTQVKNIEIKGPSDQGGHYRLRFEMNKA